MAQRGRREASFGESVGYLQAMLGELAQLARAQRLDMLAYLIEVAHLEAAELGARSVRHGGDEPPGTPVEPSGKVKLQ